MTTLTVRIVEIRPDADFDDESPLAVIRDEIIASLDEIGVDAEVIEVTEGGDDA